MQPTERRIFFILILIAGLAWIGMSADASHAGARQIPALQSGAMAPDFTLNTSQGESYHLSELRGQAVLVNLWATWCPPCRQEMPAIQSVYREYREQGFIVLAINITIQDNPLNIMPFMEQYGLTFPVLLDETGEVSARYGLRSLPTSYFINRDGTIHEVVIGGPMAEALLRARVEEIVQ
jgi:cytochrome c biogenesis protein CcmG/thiol:disulfide interchange protein DsbE